MREMLFIQKLSIVSKIDETEIRDKLNDLMMEVCNRGIRESILRCQLWHERLVHHKHDTVLSFNSR